MAMILRNSNIVLLGGFNSDIIQPVWLIDQGIVKQKADEFKVGIVLSDGPRQFKFELDEMKWEVSHDRVLVGSSKKQSPAPWLKRMLEKLPHTPIRAVGVNFKFACASTECILPLKRLSDDDAVAEKIGTVTASQLITRSARDDGTQLIVTLTASESEHVVDFNFHHAVNSAELAKRTMLRYDEDYACACSLVHGITSTEVSLDDDSQH